MVYRWAALGKATMLSVYKTSALKGSKLTPPEHSAPLAKPLAKPHAQANRLTMSRVMAT
jgi:hypothetical protein